MTRSGEVRLRRYVVEDEVTGTVPVRREEIRVEREPVTDADTLYKKEIDVDADHH
jgi:uncharacterized protein (TIGR02271 family)